MARKLLMSLVGLRYIKKLIKLKEQAIFENNRKQDVAAHQDEINRDERQKVVHAAQAKRWKLDMQRANAELAEKAKMVDHKKKLEEGGENSSFQFTLNSTNLLREQQCWNNQQIICWYTESYRVTDLVLVVKISFGL